MANLDRIREVVALIESWEEAIDSEYHFDMGVWVNVLTEERAKQYAESFPEDEWKCGTACCFAGAAAVYAHVPLVKMCPDMTQYTRVQTADGTVDIEQWARHYFGLTADQAHEIFYSTSISTAEELKGLINWALKEKVFEGVPEYTPRWWQEDGDSEYDDEGTGCDCELCS